LRTRAGVPRTAIDGAADLTAAALLAPAGADRVALTPRGRLVANEVAARLHPSPCELGALDCI
jgi:hypothetical protein